MGDTFDEVFCNVGDAKGPQPGDYIIAVYGEDDVKNVIALQDGLRLIALKNWGKSDKQLEAAQPMRPLQRPDSLCATSRDAHCVTAILCANSTHPHPSFPPGRPGRSSFPYRTCQAWVAQSHRARPRCGLRSSRRASAARPPPAQAGAAWT